MDRIQTWRHEPDHEILFTSMGMVVLDEIRFHSGKLLTDIIGGSGAYSTLGARIFQQPSSAAQIGWLIKGGSDFPTASRKKLESWGTSLDFQERQDRQTTRGRLVYNDASHTEKTFEYLSPTWPIDPTDFANTALLHSRSYHMLAGPSEVVKQVEELLALRQSAHIDSRPLIIWEPRPSSCTPECLNLFQKAVRLVDVFSPNHVELTAIFSEKPSSIDPATITGYAKLFVRTKIGPEGQGYIVVRSGEQGCFIASEKGSIWSPAFYEEADSSQNLHIVDPTGAGNAYLGAFAIGFLQDRSIYEAACYGAVGASFALEQIGMPENSLDQDNRELWNGDDVFDRLKRYRNRFKLQS